MNTDQEETGREPRPDLRAFQAAAYLVNTLVARDETAFLRDSAMPVVRIHVL